MKLVTYNIFLQSDPHVIANNILQMQQAGVDIFCLQEVLKTPGKPFVCDVIQTLLGKKWKIVYHVGNTNTYFDHGVALLWNTDVLQAVDVEQDNLPKLTKIALHAKLIETA